jgi:glutathione S-transferase
VPFDHGDGLITLYQVESCPWCAAARQGLANVDADYDVVEVPRRRDERHEVERLSGQRLVPVLVDGDTVIWDSRRIVRHLYAAYGGDARRRSMEELPEDVGGVRPLPVG